MSRYQNYLAGVGYASIFGFSFLVTKDALVALDPFELLFLRFALAAILMSLLAALGLVKLGLAAKVRLALGRSRAEAAGGDRGAADSAAAASDPAAARAALGSLGLACVFQPILYFVAETFGVRESASSTAGIVLGALPAAVAILGVFMLKERLSLRQSLSLGLSVLGVALIVLLDLGSGGGGAAGSPRGFLFLLGAVASATFYNIYSRKASRVFAPAETTFAMMWTGALAFGLVALVRGALAGRLLGAEGLLARAAPAAGAILYLGALSSVLAFFLVNFTLSRLMASQSIVFANLTTVVSVAAGVLIRGEAFGLGRLAGTAMIVIGVWGTNAAARRGRAAEER